MLDTVPAVLEKHAALWRNQPALVGEGVSLTFQAANREVDRVACALASLGVGKGDNVALMAHNRAELILGMLGTVKLGARANLWSFRTTRRELSYLLGQIRPKALIFDSELPSVVEASRGEAPGDSCAFLCTGDGQVPTWARSFLQEVSVQPETFSSPPSFPVVDPSDISTVIYTAGTMGRPKGAAYTHRTQLLSAIQYSLEMGLDRGHVGLSVAPLVHGAALNFYFAYLLLGATFVVSGRYEPEAALRLIQRYGVTEVMAVPTQILQLCDVAEAEGYRPTTLRLIRTGGSAYPVSMVERMRKVLGCDLINTYGMTENCANTTVMRTDLDPPEEWTTIGKATTFWQVRVVRMEEGREVEPDEVIQPPGRGQVIVKGPQNVREYYLGTGEPPKARDGWLYTRDVAEVDRQGYLTIVDRLDNVIKSGAMNIYPQEVEAVLLRHPKVADAAAVGVPDDTWGEVVAALVKPKAADLSVEELERYCLEAEDLGRFKRPRLICLVEEIPKNFFGKTDRVKLRTECAPRLIAARVQLSP
jgi:acyl-CoA synthetase (AMP-forming)/AMP-acid ligase II